MTTVLARSCAAPALTRRNAFFRYLSASSSSRRPSIFLTRDPLPPCLRIPPCHQHRVSLSTLSASSSPSPCINSVKSENSQELDLLKVEGDNSNHFPYREGEDSQVVAVDRSEDEDDEHGYGEVSSSHTPVLLSEVLAAFQDVQLQNFVDCTLGAAGHASSIIKSHPELRIFVGLDVDPVAHSEASKRLQDAIEHRNKNCTDASSLNLHVLEANFRNIKNSLHQLGLAHQEVDGILMDLGMSSMQLNVAERGFSLQHDGPLDMRMDPSASLTASDILNNWPEAEIGRIIREYGEERQWKRLARRISEAQLLGGIHSTSSLLQLIKKCLPSRFSPGRAGWKKTAIRVFQALRIAVNDELSSIEAALPDAFECLKPGGRLAVISFHSLEDRIVKQYFLKAMGEVAVKNSHTARESKSKYLASTHSSVEKPEGERKPRGNKMLEGRHASILTKRPLVAGLDEIKLNSRARSAKLRILVKK